MMGKGAFARREVRVSVLAGTVVALLVVVAGAGLALMSTPKWTAESVLVVLPSADLDTSDSAAYYETLSRGQIVATFAEVADNQRFQDQAEQSLQLSDAERAGVTTTVSVVPDTSVILVRTTAGTAAVAEQLADATTTLATNYLAGLSKPYRTDLVHGAAGTAAASGTSPTMLLALAVVVGLIAGVGVQQAVYHLMMSMRSGRKRTTGESPPADPTDPADAAAPTDTAAPAETHDEIPVGARDDSRTETSMVGPHGG
jgi:capsular polysaccharide biosynthesis protein